MRTAEKAIPPRRYPTLRCPPTQSSARSTAAPADRKVAVGNEPPVLEALEHQSRSADQRRHLAGAQEPIGRQVTGVEPEPRREMPVPPNSLLTTVHTKVHTICMRTVSGFEWDSGNRSKCQKHGLSLEEIEGLFALSVMILPDHTHSSAEERLRAIGRTTAGR